MSFRYLEGFSKYGVASDGQVYNLETKTWIGNSPRPGYKTIHMRHDNGELVTTGRHRLVALLYCEKKDPSFNVVNHKNGIKGDDHPDNLEWTSYKGNAEHAGEMGLTEKCKPVSVRDPLTNEVFDYPSATEAARQLGLTKDTVLWRVKKGSDRVYPDGLQYRFRTDEPWSDVSTNQFGRSKAIAVMNIHNRHVRFYDKQSDFATESGLSLAAVNVAAKSNQKILANTYIVKLLNDQTPWRDIEDPLKERLGSRPVEVIDDLTEQSVVYPSAIAAANATGLKPNTLHERLKSNGTKAYSDGLRFKYY